MVIGVFDSGIGGLSVLYKLSQKFKGVTFIYLGDNLNAPYGERNIYDLTTLTFKNLSLLSMYKPDFLVLACNTLSCNVLSRLKGLFNIPIYGVFPPIESEIMFSKKPLLLCTTATAKYYQTFSAFSYVCPITGLVNDIERFAFSLDKICIKDYFSTVFDDFDSVILGCTHYFFVKIGISDHFHNARIIDGSDYTVNYIYNRYKNQNNKKKTNENKYIFIGDSKEINSAIFFKVVLSGKTG